jgi:sugar/nucleoside kinase (ribokinase family)
MKLLALGHCPIDEVYRTDEPALEPAEWGRYGPPVLRAGGGSMANAMCLLGRLGHEPHFLATVGDDDRADFLEAELKKHGVVPCLIRKRGRRTPTIACLVRSDGDRAFAYDWGRAPADVTLADLRADAPDPAEFPLFATELFEAAARRLARSARRVVFSGQITHNPTPERKRQALLMAVYSDLAVVSDQFNETWHGVPSPTRGRGPIHRTLPNVRERAVTITTAGIGGLAAALRQGPNKPPIPFSQPVPRRVRVVDTTGAGDAFLGALLHRLGSKLRPTLEELKAACLSAQRVAGLACTHWGARGYLSDMNTVRKTLAER